jgi:hypothetical protein
MHAGLKKRFEKYAALKSKIEAVSERVSPKAMHFAWYAYAADLTGTRYYQGLQEAALSSKRRSKFDRSPQESIREQVYS